MAKYVSEKNMKLPLQKSPEITFESKKYYQNLLHEIKDFHQKQQVQMDEDKSEYETSSILNYTNQNQVVRSFGAKNIEDNSFTNINQMTHNKLRDVPSTQAASLQPKQKTQQQEPRRSDKLLKQQELAKNQDEINQIKQK